MSAERRRMRGRVAIVGAAEADEHGKLPHKSASQLHAEAARNALADAGLGKDDVDAVFSAGLWMGSETAEYLGIRPRYVDGTQIGGGAFFPPRQAPMWAVDPRGGVGAVTPPADDRAAALALARAALAHVAVPLPFVLRLWAPRP